MVCAKACSMCISWREVLSARSGQQVRVNVYTHKCTDIHSKVMQFSHIFYTIHDCKHPSAIYVTRLLTETRAHMTGVLTGNKGCESVGASPPYQTRPGGVPPRVTTVKVTETHPLMLRVEWNRSGTEIAGMCMCVCVCVCVLVCVVNYCMLHAYVWLRICINITYTNTHIPTKNYICIQTHTCIHLYVQEMLQHDTKSCNAASPTESTYLPQ
jgi:hypothetical protein